MLPVRRSGHHRLIDSSPLDVYGSSVVMVSRSWSDKWFVSFSCEVEREELRPTSEVVGVDVGLASFATFSDGDNIDNPRFYRRDEADLKRVQRRKDAAKKAEDWPENAKHKAILAKIHQRIANRRTDFAHKRSRELVDRYQVIVFEALEPQKMGKSSERRKSIRDVAWSQFIEMTVSKAEEAGRRVIVVDPRNTSKMCSRCGELVAKTLSERVHSCSPPFPPSRGVGGDW